MQQQKDDSLLKISLRHVIISSPIPGNLIGYKDEFRSISFQVYDLPVPFLSLSMHSNDLGIRVTDPNPPDV